MSAPTGPPTGPPPGWTAEQIAQASQAEIAAGRLPLRAQWRLNEQREDAAFTSDLTTDEHAALRSVGFSPVGQALGSAVYNTGWNYTGCNYSYGGFLTGYRPAPVVDMPRVRDLLWRARESAIQRMRQECAGLGGDGVVAIRLHVRPFYGNGLEFTAIGTAVRADARPDLPPSAKPPQPFSSDLSGQDFAKLLRAGYLPVALVLGVGAVLRHDDWSTWRQSSSWQNQEMDGYTQLITAARAQARQGIAADAARHGGGTVVLRDMQVNIAEITCRSYRRGSDSEAHDHMVEATMWGTSVVPLPAHHPRPAAPAPLAMLRLDNDPTRRRRARANQEGKA